MADGGQVERFVVMSACGEHRAIVQSTCLGLTGTDIHIYNYIIIYIHIRKRGTTMHHDYLTHYRLGNYYSLFLTVHCHKV